MKKILILEDDPNRVLKFYEMFEYHSLTITNTSEAAIEIASSHKFDVIFLDHDLDGRVYVNSDEKNTGYQVAKILPSTINKNTPVIIHSWNGVGAKRMMGAMNESGMNSKIIHFGYFDSSIIKEN